MDRVAIALGSNLGDRRAHLDFALARLTASIQNLRVSSYYETEPVDAPDSQPAFLNAACVGDTALSARQFQTRFDVSAYLAKYCWKNRSNVPLGMNRRPKSASAWWRRAPFLPIPDGDYLTNTVIDFTTGNAIPHCMPPGELGGDA